MPTAPQINALNEWPVNEWSKWRSDCTRVRVLKSEGHSCHTATARLCPDLGNPYLWQWREKVSKSLPILGALSLSHLSKEDALAGETGWCRDLIRHVEGTLIDHKYDWDWRDQTGCNKKQKLLDSWQGNSCHSFLYLLIRRTPNNSALIPRWPTTPGTA